jgi:RsmE family RNA methyltransferase
VNLLLFTDADLADNGHLTVHGRQHQHLCQTLTVAVGDTVKVGAIGGLMGTGQVLATTADATTLSVTLSKPPPPPIPLKLILALPRPKMMRRVLQAVASLGIKEIHLINSYRVDKSFWQSPWLEPQATREQCLLGLEQCGDTLLPEVHLHKRFKPFVEDQLPAIIEGTRALVAHPYTATPCPVDLSEPATLAVGPEGGFIPYEIEKLETCGFAPVTLGARILRVETAIPVLIARMFV